MVRLSIKHGKLPDVRQGFGSFAPHPQRYSSAISGVAIASAKLASICATA